MIGVPSMFRGTVEYPPGGVSRTIRIKTLMPVSTIMPKHPAAGIRYSFFDFFLFLGGR